MALFGCLYSVPYPLMLYLAMKLLERKRISKRSFYVGVFFPLVVVFYWSFLLWRQPDGEGIATTENTSHSGDDSAEEDDEIEQAIYGGFKGGYRASEGGTQYWECVMMIRRLLLSATTLIPNSMIQLVVCLALCTIFLLHHAHVKPFQHSVSNKAETFSLTLLIGIAGINLMKSCFLHLGVTPQGSQVEIMLNLGLLEKMFVLFLLAFILCFEIIFKLKKKAAKVSVQNDWRLMLPFIAVRVESDRKVELPCDLCESDVQVVCDDNCS